jgi:hypothetical protein
MENFISSSFEFPSINVIGDGIQSLQVVLKKNESLIINSQYLSYVSSMNLQETQYNKINNLIPNSNDNKANNTNYIRLKNINNTIEYIGLSHLGKIIKINPLLYKDLMIREDCILCFNESLNLINDNEINKKIKENINDFSIIDIKNLKRNYYLLNRKIQKKNELDNLVLDINSLMKDFLYISSNKNLIEKRLGVNEQIIIMKNQLIAFENSITFSKIIKSQENKSTYVNYEIDLICDGPGLLIYELNERKNIPFKMQTLLSLLIIIILISFLDLFISSISNKIKPIN